MSVILCKVIQQNVNLATLLFKNLATMLLKLLNVCTMNSSSSKMWVQLKKIVLLTSLKGMLRYNYCQFGNPDAGIWQPWYLLQLSECLHSIRHRTKHRYSHNNHIPGVKITINWWKMLTTRRKQPNLAEIPQNLVTLVVWQFSKCHHLIS